MPRPLLPLVIALIAGIATGYFLRLPDLPLLAAILLIFSFLFLSLIKNRASLILPLTACALFILGILNINYSLYRIPEVSHVVHHISKEKLTLEGIINEDPQESPDGKTVVVAARAIVKGDNYIPAEGLIMLSVPLPDVPLKYGDLIRMKTRLRMPHNFQNPGSFDYAKQLRGRGILVRGTIGNSSDIVLIREDQGNIFKMGLEGFRDRLRKIIAENATTPQREIILALLLGEKKLIPPTISEVFKRTGTSHILAISGLHVGMIASFSIFFALLFMKASPFLLLRFNAINAASFFALMPVAAYACIAGLGVSVVRAAIMIIVFLVAVLIRKEREMLNTLALAAFIILLFTPSALFDVSFQLSFAAVAALILTVPVLSNICTKSDADSGMIAPSLSGKVARHILLFIFVSLSATLGTLPLIAYYFNGISTVSLPANCVIVPLMGMLALPVGMAVIIATPLSTALAALLVKAASFFVETAMIAAGFLSSLPGAFLTVTTPSLPEIACFYLLLAVIIKMLEGRKNKKAGRTGGASQNFLKLALTVLVIFFVADYVYFAFRDNFRRDLRITAIDVGQGSSSLIRLPAGKNMLIDGGGSPAGSFDVGKYVLAPYLWRERIKEIEAVVLTHPHPDHLQGLIYILENFHIKGVWTNGDAANTELYRNFIKIIREKGIAHRIINNKAAPLTINGVAITILNPATSFNNACKAKDDELVLSRKTGQNRRLRKKIRRQGAQIMRNAAYLPYAAVTKDEAQRSIRTFYEVVKDEFDDANNASLVMKIAFGKISFLLSGDISAPTEKRLVETGADLRSDVLFVPHHGGFASSTRPFLDMVKPRIAVISCGYDNIFRLPHPDVLKRYADVQAKVYRTDLNGAITITTDGVGITVKTVNGKE